MVTRAATPAARRNAALLSAKKELVKNWDLYLFMLVPICFVVVFNYGPMYGAQIAFKKFMISKGILGSPWVGLTNFQRFFKTYTSLNAVRNTIIISLYSLAAGFPIPILLALALSHSPFPRFKKIIQMITYAPYFISVVVMCGMIIQFLKPRTGVVNILLGLIGVESVNFMAEPTWFTSIYVWTGVWQGMGWGSIIYLAALSGVSPELHESAVIDGASILQRMRHIDLPGIAPVISIQLILSAGGMLNVGFEKVYLLQNSINVNYSEVIQSLVYKIGLKSSGTPDFSYATAVGLMTSAANLVILLTTNTVLKKMNQQTLI
ncbi:MAG: ABC transporter permease subunit [Oscillospiraceae bacterium]|jgi:ABC-type polysaccharide transport system permease subunit|nr:ABC transporter permease subunit [Oscillospiraceae bacterium]